MAQGKEQLVVEVAVHDATGALDGIVRKVEQAGKRMDAALVPKAGGKPGAGVEGIDRSASKAAASVDQLGSALTRALGPAGGVLGSLSGGLVDAAGGTGKLTAALGLSSSALLGIGIGVGAVTALGVALFAAASAAAEVERALRPVVARSKDWAASLPAIKDGVSAIAIATAKSSEEIAAGFAAAAETGFATAENAMERVRLAAEAASVGFGTTAQAVQQLDAVLDAFGLSGDQAEQVIGRLLVGSRVGETSIGKYADAMQRSAVVATTLGVSFDGLAATIALVGKRTGDVEKASQAISVLLTKLASPTDQARLKLQALGVDLSEAAMRGRDLPGILADIGAAIERLPSGQRVSFMTELVGSPKTAQQLFTALTLDAEEFNRVMRELPLGVREFEQALARVGDLPSEQIARSVAEVRSVWEGLGDWWQVWWAAAFGTPAPIKVSLEPEALVTFRSDLERALRAADAGAAVAAASALQAAADRVAVTAHLIQQDEWDRGDTRSAADAGPPVTQGPSPEEQERVRTVILAGVDAVQEMQAALEKMGAVNLVDPLTGQMREVERVARDAAGKIAFVFKDMPVNLDVALGPLGAVAVEVLPEIVPDKWTQAVEEALALVPARPIEIPFAPLPEGIEAARRLVESVQGKPAILIAPDERERLENAIDLLRRHARAVDEAAELASQVRARSAEGADRQAAENDALLAGLDRRVGKLQREGAQVDDLRRAVEELRRAQATRIDEAQAKQEVDLGVQVLQLRAAQAEKARDLAAASGDTAAAERLGAEAIAAKAAAGAAAADQAIAAMRVQLKGRDDLIGQLEVMAGLLRGQVSLEEEIGKRAADRARAERGRETRRTFQDAYAGLLVGLDAELDAIERNRRAREDSARAADRDGKLAAGALEPLLALYDRIAERDAAQARRAAELRQTEQVAGMLREVSDEYAVQRAAIDATRAAERERLVEALQGQALTQDAMRATLALFDLSTRKAQERAAVQAVGAPREAVAQANLLADAYTRAADEAAAMGLAGEAAAQHIVESMRGALQTVDALMVGMGAGLQGALDEVNNSFRLGVEGARDVVLSFRDEMARAWSDWISGAKSGTDAAEAFAVAWLQSIGDVATKYAASQLTSAVFTPVAESLGGEAGAGLKGALGLGETGMQLAATEFTTATTAFSLAVSNFALASAVPADAIGAGAEAVGGEVLAAAPAAGAVESLGFAAGIAVGPIDALGVAAGVIVAPIDSLGTTAGLSVAPLSALTTQAGLAATGATALVGPFAAAVKAAVALAGALNAAATAAVATSGFAEGGILPGVRKMAEGGIIPGQRTMAPLRNRKGGRYDQRTLIEVAEIPGLQEVVIPLKGGAVPVEVNRRGPPEGAGGASKRLDEILEGTRHVERAVVGAEGAPGVGRRRLRQPEPEPAGGRRERARTGAGRAAERPEPREAVAGAPGPKDPLVAAVRDLVAQGGQAAGAAGVPGQRGGRARGEPQTMTRLVLAIPGSQPTQAPPPDKRSLRDPEGAPAHGVPGKRAERARSEPQAMTRLVLAVPGLAADQAPAPEGRARRGPDLAPTSARLAPRAAQGAQERASRALAARRELGQVGRRDATGGVGGARGAVQVGVRVDAPITITVNGSGAGVGQGSDRDMEKRLLSLAPQLRREFAAALDSGLDRRLIDAVRGAAR